VLRHIKFKFKINILNSIKLHYFFTEEWQKINTGPVCFGARGDTNGPFHMVENGLIHTFKLAHRTGTLRYSSDKKMRTRTLVGNGRNRKNQEQYEKLREYGKETGLKTTVTTPQGSTVLFEWSSFRISTTYTNAIPSVCKAESQFFLQFWVCFFPPCDVMYAE